MKKYFILLLILVLSLVAASQASAGTAKMGERYRLESGETVSENLYVGSGDINLAGNVLGDFIAGGGNVTVTGSVAKDTMLAGGSLNILGMTGEDLRVAGGNIIIGESVGGDLVAVGGSVQVLSGVTVGGEALVAGGSVVIDGTIQKDLVVSGGDVQINGRVMGNVRAKRVDRLTLGSNAVIEGNLDYGSRREAVISEGARVGGAVNFDQITKPARYGRGAEKGFIAALLGLFTLIALTKFAIIATAALLLVYFFRDGLLPKRSAGISAGKCCADLS
jgi:acetyltransferase-like isoleucine patch superfamily enzyme